MNNDLLVLLLSGSFAFLGIKILFSGFDDDDNNDNGGDGGLMQQVYDPAFLASPN
ncbi:MULTISPECIES: hypothetical protein [Prochlorococcus]|uniref:hypothetical protein n=1 Tax=Prochlorococcus TaxID=1218 RepID=UPI0005338976|nr:MULTISPECIES: hypothetical protein [Prochlorococcus]KGG12532.1 hypothetical protein EV05_1744 [Prochlorococcus sp. MIT 0601]